jgi:hypothetical protein
MAGRDAASRTQQPSDDPVKHRHNEKASTDARTHRIDGGAAAKGYHRLSEDQRATIIEALRTNA